MLAHLRYRAICALLTTWIVVEERKHEGSQSVDVGSTAVDRVAWDVTRLK